MTNSFLRSSAMAAAVVVGIGAAASLAYAHGGAQGVTKERMELMKGMGDAMKVMAAMFKQQAPYQADVVAEKAALLAEDAPKIPDLTPEGSNEKPSEALPIIWEDWDTFVEQTNRLEVESSKLAEIASNGGDEREVKIQFVKVSKSCGACHERFRKPKEDQQS